MNYAAGTWFGDFSDVAAVAYIPAVVTVLTCIEQGTCLNHTTY